MFTFPISRDPPEGGTAAANRGAATTEREFPISRDPPEGGTQWFWAGCCAVLWDRFQFLGISLKGELYPY